MYVYGSIYVNKYTSTNSCICINVYVCTHIYVYMYTCIHVYMYMTYTSCGSDKTAGEHSLTFLVRRLVGNNRGVGTVLQNEWPQ